MALRFAILREVLVGRAESPRKETTILLEYDQETIVQKLVGYIRLSLVRDKGTFQKKFTISQIETAVEDGWKSVINELKKESVKVA